MWRTRTSSSLSMPTQCSMPPMLEMAAGLPLHLATSRSRMAARTSACSPCPTACNAVSFDLGAAVVRPAVLHLRVSIMIRLDAKPGVG